MFDFQKNHDEHALITRTQQGDTDAFNPLVTKYQPKIYTLIYQQVQNRETAKDLCQDVFLKAFLALPNFRGDSAFYSWLYQIAQNACIDFFRRQNTHAKTFGFPFAP